MNKNELTIPRLLSQRVQNFPDPNLALLEPNGLLAIGGSLSSEQLIIAYQSGIFPWFNENDPILWWSPTPRALLYPLRFKRSKSLKKALKGNIKVTCDLAFESVINHCRTLRKDKEGTWITPQMQSSYIELHEQGIAHSIEVWNEDILIGGLYGISMGKAFFGESMFHLESNASKIALLALCHLPIAFDFIDCQIPSAHLHSLGSTPCSRVEYLKKLKTTLLEPSYQDHWLIEPLSGLDLLNLSN